MFGNLYDFIYNKVEEAGNAIQDVATSITCPDVDKYIEENKMSSDDKKKKKKKGKNKMMSDFEFRQLTAHMPFGPEHELFRKYLNGSLTTGVDSEKLRKRLMKAYSNGETVFDVVAREGYDVKVKKDGSLKIKKMKKEKPSPKNKSESNNEVVNPSELDSETLLVLQMLGNNFESKLDELVETILDACDTPDDIDYILEYLAENDGLQISIDVSKLMFRTADELKERKQSLIDAAAETENDTGEEEEEYPETEIHQDEQKEETNSNVDNTADSVIPLPDLQAEKSTDAGDNKPVVQPVTDIPPVPKKPEPKNKTKQQKSKKEKEVKTEPESEGSGSESDKMNFADAAGIKVD